MSVVRLDEQKKYVFPEVVWKQGKETAPVEVQLILDMPMEALVIADATRQLDFFRFSEIVVHCESSETDSRQRVKVQPWRTMIRACSVQDTRESSRGSSLSAPSAATTALCRGRSAGRAAERSDWPMAANRPSNGSTLSRMALGAPGPAASPQNDRESEKAAWLCLLTPPAARLFLLIATSLGVVQSGLNFTDKWRISQFAGAGSFADVYAAKGEDDTKPQDGLRAAHSPN